MKMRMTRRGPILATLLTTLLASPAFATSVYTQVLGADVPAAGPVGTASAQLYGDGGGTLTHTFSLTDPGIRIVSAAIAIYVADDSGCFGRSGVGLLGCDWVDHFYEREEVALEVGGSVFAQGGLGGYFHSIAPSLLSSPIHVTARSITGSARIVSMLRVEYENGVAAIPEPGAAAVFGIGTLLVGWASRRPRR
jgi:hypothetical protein